MDRDLINQVREQNGNRDFTQKDMLLYLVGRVDKIHDKLDNKVDKKTFYWAFTIFVTVIIAIVYAT